MKLGKFIPMERFDRKCLTRLFLHHAL
jgi:hypothetical protein